MLIFLIKILNTKKFLIFLSFVSIFLFQLNSSLVPLFTEKYIMKEKTIEIYILLMNIIL